MFMRWKAALGDEKLAVRKDLVASLDVRNVEREGLNVGGDEELSPIPGGTVVIPVPLFVPAGASEDERPLGVVKTGAAPPFFSILVIANMKAPLTVKKNA
jgi:hypothetical protein